MNARPIDELLEGQARQAAGCVARGERSQGIEIAATSPVSAQCASM